MSTFATTVRRKSRFFLPLGRAGCRGEKVGPIARMFLEHQVTKEMAVAAKMEQPEKNISSQATLTRL